MSTVQGGQGNIVTNGLVLNLDAANPRSYPQPYNGTTWQNIAPVSSSLTGSLVNGPLFSTSGSGCITFDGVDDSVDLGNILFNSASATTIDMWVNFPSMSGGRYPMAKGSFGDGSAFTFAMITGFGPSGGGSSYIRFSMGNQYSVNSTNIEYGSLIWNQWYNFTFTYDGAFVTGYRNASNAISSPLSGSLYTSTTPIYLGRSKYGNYSNSNISSFKIYNRALSASEVLQNFNATRARFGV
jgi:hypothetical protein